MWTSTMRRTIRREQRGPLTRTGCLATPNMVPTIVKERAGSRRAQRRPARSRRAPRRGRRAVRARRTMRAPPIRRRDRHGADNGRSRGSDQRGACRRVHRMDSAATSPWWTWRRESHHRRHRRVRRRRAPRDRSQRATCSARTRQRRGPTTATTPTRGRPPRRVDSRAWPRGRSRSDGPAGDVPASRRPHRRPQQHACADTRSTTYRACSSGAARRPRARCAAPSEEPRLAVARPRRDGGRVFLDAWTAGTARDWRRGGTDRARVGGGAGDATVCGRLLSRPGLARRVSRASRDPGHAMRP